jgi:hypothetical protein
MAASATVVTTRNLAFSDLGGIALDLGNSDRKRMWGTKSWSALNGTPVFDLQSALVSIGLLDAADGEFGPKTKIALQRYVWYRRNIDHALQTPPQSSAVNGIITPTSPLLSGALPGTCDRGLACDLLGWKQRNLVVTTPLVRASLASFSNITLDAGFAPLDYPFSQPNEVLLHPDFAGVLAVMDGEAAKANVSIRLTQALRREGFAVTGAIVHPAGNSAHFVGRAVDWKVVDGNLVVGGAQFLAGKQTKAADLFVQGVKAQGYRWGGDFGDVDPVHFDDNPYSNIQKYSMTRFFVQQSYRATHPMRLLS